MKTDEIQPDKEPNQEEDILVEFCPRCYGNNIKGFGRRMNKCFDCGLILSSFPTGPKNEIPEKKTLSHKEIKEWDNQIKSIRKKHTWVLVLAVVIFSILYFKVDVLELRIGFGVLIFFMFMLYILGSKKQVKSR